MTRAAKIPQAGVYLAPAETEALRAEAQKIKLAWYELNLARVASKKEFLAACAKSLRLPQWFGGNWDALADCLKDQCADTVVNWRNCEDFAAAAPDDYATALEIFQDAASYWKERGSAFLVLVDVAPDGGDLPRLPG